MIWNVSQIISNNYKLLSKDAHKSHIVFCLFLIPIIISFILPSLNFKLNANQFNYIISFVTIIVGFLINVSVILISERHSKGLIGNEVHKRTFANVFYTVLVGIFIILTIIIEPWANLPIHVSYMDFVLDISKMFNFVILFVFFHFIIMILVTIKGFYALYK